MIFFIISTRKSQQFTYPSIASLFRTTHFRRGDRIVVVDNDCSLDAITGVEIIRNSAPYSFAKNANIGLSISQKANDDLILLNNDIIYTRHWLDYLSPGQHEISVPFCNQDAAYTYRDLELKFAMDFEDYRDEQVGSLETIAQVHREKWLSALGKRTDLLIPFFCAHIPVCVSHEVGYFDEQFGRGGAEDVDYRIRAYKAGFQVVKAPLSYVLHFMGKSTWRSGENSDTTATADITYRKYFVAKWGKGLADLLLAGSKKSELAEHYGLFNEVRNGDFGAIVRRLAEPQTNGEINFDGRAANLERSQYAEGILIIDDLLPNGKRDAGSNLILSHIKSLRRLGHSTYFFAMLGDQCSGPDADRLNELGCVPLGSPNQTFDDVIKFACEHLEWIYVQRPNNMKKVLDLLKSSNIKVVYGVVDLHHVRLEREARFFPSASLEKRVQYTKDLELEMAEKSWATISPSFIETNLLNSTISNLFPHTVPWDVPISFDKDAIVSRTGLAFVGGYNHFPNVDAANILVNEIMPLVWSVHPDYKCMLVGSNMPESVRDLGNENVEAIGFVQDLDVFFRKIRLSVAPMRFGAGLKGKVLESLAAGVPCVLGPIAAEGLRLPDKLKWLIGQDNDTISARICELIRNDDLYDEMVSEGITFIQSQFSKAIVDLNLARIFGVRTMRESSKPILAAGESSPASSNLVVVDIGAAGGMKDDWRDCGMAIEAVLFEPNALEAERLRNKEEFSTDKLKVVEKALASVPGKKTLHKTKSLGCWSLRAPNVNFLKTYSIAPAFSVRESVDIEVTTYSQLHREKVVPRPDVIKIDVQGFEFEVLVGFGDLLSGCIAIELEAHFYQVYEGQRLLHDIIGYLDNFGLSLRRVTPTGKFDGDLIEADAWFTVSASRRLSLSELEAKKLQAVERAWRLDTHQREFDANNWDSEW